MDGCEFKCFKGECDKCCTTPQLQIPVTLPDLYRRVVYEKQLNNKDTTIPEVYRQLCDGWMYLPDIENRGNLLPNPKSKITCPNLDLKTRLCSVHDTVQYSTCRPYPEAMLIPAMPGYEDSPMQESFWKNLECMKGVKLSAEREEKIKGLCDLTSREYMLTGRLLLGVQPVNGSTREEVEAVLDERISFYNLPEFVENLFMNMKLNNLQERYMKLFGIKPPLDYTVKLLPKEPAERKAMGISLFNPLEDVYRSLRRAQKAGFHNAGRNDPCPCGSQKKFKKCCGGHS